LQQNLDKTNKDMAALGQQKQALDNHLKQTQAKLNDTEKAIPNQIAAAKTPLEANISH